MNTIKINSVPFNRVGLNVIGEIRSSAGGGGGGGDVPDVPVEPDIPEGYEAFEAFDGAFSASDGEFYVKL